MPCAFKLTSILFTINLDGIVSSLKSCILCDGIMNII